MGGMHGCMTAGIEAGRRIAGATLQAKERALERLAERSGASPSQTLKTTFYTQIIFLLFS